MGSYNSKPPGSTYADQFPDYEHFFRLLALLVLIGGVLFALIILVKRGVAEAKQQTMRTKCIHAMGVVHTRKLLYYANSMGGVENPALTLKIIFRDSEIPLCPLGGRFTIGNAVELVRCSEHGVFVPPTGTCERHLVKVRDVKLAYAVVHGLLLTAESPDMTELFVGSSKLPSCPEGGLYTLGTLGEVPRCSITSHVLK